MARKTRIALPRDDEYLTLIGQVAYMVSPLEWTITGDLPGPARYLPPDLTTSALVCKSMSARLGHIALFGGVREIGSYTAIFVYGVLRGIGLYRRI